MKNEIQQINIEDYNKLENVCYPHPRCEENLCEDIEDYFDLIDFSDNNDDNETIIEKAKEISIYEKEPFKISVDWLWENLTDYADENFSMGYFDAEPNGMDIVEKFVEDFNSAQTWHTQGKKVAVLDLSEEVKQFIKEQQSN